MAKPGLKAASMAAAVPLTLMLRVASDTESTLRPNFFKDFVTLSASSCRAPNFSANS